MTLNDLERRNGRYTALFLYEFGKPAFQLRTTGSSIEHFDQNLRGAKGQRTMFILDSLKSA